MNRVLQGIHKWQLRVKIFFRLLLVKLGLDDRPAFAVLTVNGGCNFQCGYCFADYYLNKNEFLPTERIFQTINELYDYGVLYLNVHGGEPLLRKDIGQILNYALDKGMFVNLITNGAFLEKKWEEVKNVHTLCISLDGKEENNDKNRGEGSYQKAVHAIEFALSKGMTTRLGMTITKHTQNDMRWMAEWAKERKIYVHPFLLFDQDSLPEDMWMTPEENKTVLRNLVQLKKEGYPIFYSYETLMYSLNWPYDKPVISKRDLENLELKEDFKLLPPCPYKKYNVLTESDGTVRACNILVRGHAHVSFLDGKTVEEAKKELLEESDCLYCYHLPTTEQSHLLTLSSQSVVNQAVKQLFEDIRNIGFFWRKKTDQPSSQSTLPKNNGINIPIEENHEMTVESVEENRQETVKTPVN